MVQRYEFYFRVAKQYFTNERSKSKILFLPQEKRQRQKDINKIIDFYWPKSNCDGSNLQYSNIRHCLQ